MHWFEKLLLAVCLVIVTVACLALILGGWDKVIYP